MTTIGLIPSQVLASLNKDAGGNWLNVPEGQTVVSLVKTSPPAFNSATQKLVPAAPLWFSNRVERQFTVVSLSAEELDNASRLAKRTAVGNAVATLRQWKTDADTATGASWTADTTADKFAKLKVVIQRFGTLCDRMADFIQAQRIDV